MSIHGGKPLFGLLKYLIDTHPKAVITSLLLHSNDAHDYWSLYFHTLQSPRHSRELFPVVPKLGMSLLFLDHLQSYIPHFRPQWTDDFVNDWLIPVLLEYLPLLKSSNISDHLPRDAFINCLCILLDSKDDSMSSDEELITPSGSFEGYTLIKFIATNAYTPLNSLWHSQLPAPDISVTKALSSTLKSMSFYSLLEHPITMNVPWLQHNQYGIKAYHAVLELWSMMPDVVPGMSTMSRWHA